MVSGGNDARRYMWGEGGRTGHHASCSNRLYTSTIGGPSLWVNIVASDAGVLEMKYGIVRITICSRY